MSEALPTPRELQRRIEAERLGRPFLLYRRDDDTEGLFTLADDSRPVTIGRGEACDVRLLRDPEVSRLHAELEHLGGTWVVVDDGLSRNGTFVNGERISGRHRLAGGDVLRCGDSLLTFRDPSTASYDSTRPAADTPATPITESQRRVLVALCRPLYGGGTYAMPAGNKEIADELVLTVGAVKGHLRALFERFGVEDLPQNRKRLRLVERAVETGVIDLRELERS
ncbi:MAG: FHA domain-containing protein [Actinobacteria bacterium]|nr:FHA domain-containing protein [Actinomycetota bacterium]